jgi:type I restriction enzyme S subunit
MKFDRYEKYKQSGIEWLGEIPLSWTIKRLGNFFNERREKVSDKDFAPLSVTKNGVVPQLEKAAKSDDGDNRKKVCIGDFVINSRSDRKGSSGASSLIGSVSLINTVITPNKDIDIKFAHQLFRSVSFQEEYYRYGKGIVADLWSTNYSEMKNISIAIPQLEEQRAITSFLEDEITKVDTLISGQEKLIEILKERRQAVIFQAVTKGLNQEAKMIDSGVDWLGEIPENWDVIPFKWFAKCKSGDGISGLKISDDKDEQHPFPVIGGGNAVIGYTDKFNINHFVLALGRVGACGNVHEINEPAWISDNALIVDIQSEKLDLDYASMVLKSRNLNEIASRTAQPLITGTQVREQRIPVPSLEEQKSIIKFIKVEIDKIDELIAQCYESIGLCQERRSALISAAVTGQIDVSNYQIKEVA